jgi:citrate lyase synthetase
MHRGPPQDDGRDGHQRLARAKVYPEREIEKIRPLVPDSTYRFFVSDEAAPVIEAIRKAQHVIHH